MAIFEGINNSVIEVINRGARGGAAAPGAILNCLDSISQDVASEPRRRLLKVPLRVL